MADPSNASPASDSRYAIIGLMQAGPMVRASRRRSGLTQRQLAEAAGVPQATVGRIEAGSVSPRAETLIRLLGAAGHELSVERRIGEGIDRTLIQDRLRMTPEERIRLAAEEARAMPEIRVRR
jgi:transcriptional regulator with XRE-family HTH domain